MDKDRLDGMRKKVVGSFKETAGKVTGNFDLEVRGTADQAAGTAQEAVGNAKDAARSRLK